MLDSGTVNVTLFDVQATTMTREMFTMTGRSAVGTLLGKPVIGGRASWHGKAVAMPASLFKAVYGCNSEGYPLLE